MNATPVLEQAPAPPNTDYLVAPRGLGDLFTSQTFTISEEELGERTRVSITQDDAWSGLTKQMIHASCAFFAQEVLTGPPEFPYNGRFIIGPHHDEWDDLILDHNRLMVEAARDHGKCSRGDALILTPGGDRIRIDEWRGGDLWSYDPNAQALVRSYAPPSRPNGVKLVLRVRTISGREVVVTENHPLRTLDGWCWADKLQVGQRIGVTSGQGVTAPVVSWECISSIESLGLDETWSIHVPGLENYVANDIINHNTFFFDFAYPLWKIVTTPGGQGFIFSNTQDQAVRILADIKQELEHNPRLRYLVPSRKAGGRWSSTSIQCTNGHRIYARGFGTKVRGAHPNWIVVDDGLNDETMYSELVRKKQIEYFYSAITNMIVPSGQIIVVGCVPEDTWVATESGLVQIGALNPGSREPKALHDLSLGVLGKNGFQKTSKFFVNGECPTKRVTLEGMFRLGGSHRHPLWVMGEDGVADWVRSDDIRVGDYAAVNVGMDVWGGPVPVPKPIGNRPRNEFTFPTEVNADLAYLIGLWTAEGSFEATGRVSISNTDPEIQEWLGTYPFGMRFESHQDGHTLRCRAKTFLDVLEGLGGKLGTAPTKVIPSAIMAAPKALVIEFLRGLFDLSANVEGDNQQVTFETESEDLARNIQMLLLNLGMIAYLSRSISKSGKRLSTGGKYPLWMVCLSGRDAYRYMSRVGFRLSRKQSMIQGMDPDSEVGFRGIPHQQNACVSRIREHLKHDHLAWLRVTDIEDRNAFTVDFVIEGDHSFVTNGIVSHNTPFHGADLYADLSKNPEYEFSRYAAITPEGKALWPGRYSLKTLLRKKSEIGPIRFTREFLCEPISDDMSLFPSYLFVGETVEQFTLTLGMPKAFWDEMGVTIFIGVDFALSSSVQADYTVIWVMGLDSYGNRWIIDIVRGKGMPYQMQLSKINELGKKYEAALVYLEANQAQRIFGDELIRTTDLPIKLFTTGVEKNALDKGVPSLRVLLENRKFRIPRGDARSIELTNLWREEMNNFTFTEGKLQSVGSHDDTVMAAWICDQAIRAGGFSFDFGDEEEDGDSDAFDKMMAEMTDEPEKVKRKPTDVDADGVIGPASGNLIDDDDDDPLSVRAMSALMPGGIVGEWF